MTEDFVPASTWWTLKSPLNWSAKEMIFDLREGGWPKYKIVVVVASFDEEDSS